MRMLWSKSAKFGICISPATKGVIIVGHTKSCLMLEHGSQSLDQRDKNSFGVLTWNRYQYFLSCLLLDIKRTITNQYVWAKLFMIDCAGKIFNSALCRCCSVVNNLSLMIESNFDFRFADLSLVRPLLITLVNKHPRLRCNSAGLSSM